MQFTLKMSCQVFKKKKSLCEFAREWPWKTVCNGFAAFALCFVFKVLGMPILAYFSYRFLEDPKDILLSQALSRNAGFLVKPSFLWNVNYQLKWKILGEKNKKQKFTIFSSQPFLFKHSFHILSCWSSPHLFFQAFFKMVFFVCLVFLIKHLKSLKCPSVP